ncbi:MAG: hypothetical protein JJT76_13065 [Clostridiaceae bacterium]|nr:hypothetical protein [Clostridiaceae bacterium]
MNRSRFKKTFILGVCVTLLSSSVAFANGGGSMPSSLMDQPPKERVEIDEGQARRVIESPTDPLDSAVMDYPQEPRSIDEEILQRQREIDKYLFEDHTEEMNEKDFRVTHTGPYNDYVEVGITPYSEKNANYLYELLGEDKVKVVEGYQAELLNTALATSGIEADMVVEGETSSQSSSSNKSVLYALGAFILGAGSVIITRRFKSVK